MNKKQKITVWVATGVLTLMLLVPPWKYVLNPPPGMEMEPRGLEVNGPYSLIFTPPVKEPVYGTMKFYGYARQYWLTRLDIPRLVLPMCAVAVVAAGLFVTFGSGKGKS